MRIREIATVRVRYGYQRIHVLLRREGWMINRKRVYRLYKLEGLNLRSKRPRRHVSAAHRERVPGTAANDQWSMDSVSDALFNGKEAWRLDYNASRPHSALGHLTPLEFAARSARNGGSQRRKLSA
jgi:transposase InsO family protein